MGRGHPRLLEHLAHVVSTACNGMLYDGEREVGRAMGSAHATPRGSHESVGSNDSGGNAALLYGYGVKQTA